MVIQQWILAMSLGLASLPTLPVMAQDSATPTSRRVTGVSFATADGLFLIQPLDSQRQTLINSGNKQLSRLVWSPDGQQLAIVQNSTEVYRVSPATKRATQVFASQCQRPADLNLIWQGNGQTLLIQQRCTPPDPNGQSQWEVFLADATGQLNSFTGLPEFIESDLYSSPQGDRIAYVANQQIYVVGLDGSPPRQITTEPGVYTSAGSPLAWSPDGTKIAFYEGSYPFQRIILVEVNTGRRQVLTPEENFQIYRSQLVWSPNSRYIAFYQPHNPPLSNQEVVVLIEVTTGERQILTRPGFYNALSWSPNSQQIAFSAGRQLEQQTLFSLELSSQTFTALTPESFQTILESHWDPQGDWIAFTAVARGDDLGIQMLHVVRPDATQFTALTQPDEYAFPFAWVPLP
jgi:Tol biopolymer transport system component